jgi:hypothetical protein
MSAPDGQAASNSNTILWGIVVITSATIIGVVLLLAFHAAETVAVVASIIGLTAPVIAALLVVFDRMNQIHKELNSRLTELVEATRKAEHAEGVAVGVRQEQARTTATGVQQEQARAEGMVAGVQQEQDRQSQLPSK